MIKLDNHRQLKPNEIIRKGDFYKNNKGIIFPVDVSIGQKISEYSQITFWRRKHTKKQPAAPSRAGDKYPTVNFRYKNIYREVQVIKMDVNYIFGLEKMWGSHGEYKWQFKKFLRSRLQTQPVLVKLADK